jgi:hypothetical protein
MTQKRDQWRSYDSEVTSGGVMTQQESEAECLRTETSGRVMTPNWDQWRSNDSEEESGTE